MVFFNALLSTVATLRSDALIVITGALYSLVWILAILAVVQRKKQFLKITALLSLSLALWLGLTAPRLYRLFTQTEARLITDAQPVFSSFVDKKELFTLRAGDTLWIVKIQRFPTTDPSQPKETWAYIETTDHRNGWMKDPVFKKVN